LDGGRYAVLAGGTRIYLELIHRQQKWLGFLHTTGATAPRLAPLVNRGEMQQPVVPADA
jgi:hypothetical protein